MISTLLRDEPHADTSAFDHSGPTLSILDIHVHLVTIRATRLRRLIALNAPEIVLRNEMRMLCAGVNALIEHGNTSSMTRHETASAPASIWRRRQQRLQANPN